MKTSNCPSSSCRHCRFYTPEGRRGGNCQQLGVLVRGGWKACSLALPPFAPSWEDIKPDLILLEDQRLRVEGTLSLERVFHQPSAQRHEAQTDGVVVPQNLNKPDNGEHFVSVS
ncbi:hypothetical protein J0895_05370 [Phormidium pseudopriestleyi FRX01]|uniref:Uncharacterized protein n=1 Tax=Phormidium pseudopriestleyi FRX01 TaxID=1759528 RepID=A0ABS3FN52_9CYAN|nr:hypothetical protein [Phormidium pseudopriestleyi]MBO0348544.1 hypothetical protein [Phormidium pseudopriestleyi FRX01]